MYFYLVVDCIFKFVEAGKVPKIALPFSSNTKNSGLYNKPLGKVSPPARVIVRGIFLKSDFSLVVPFLLSIDILNSIWD